MLGDKVGCTYALYSLGKAAYRQGEYQLALAYNIERLSIEASMKNKQGVASADSWLGWIRAALGEYAQAEADYSAAWQAIKNWAIFQISRIQSPGWAFWLACRATISVLRRICNTALI